MRKPELINLIKNNKPVEEIVETAEETVEETVETKLNPDYRSGIFK